MAGASTPRALRAWIIEEATQPGVKIWGLSAAERLWRTLLAAGLSPDQISAGPSADVHGQEETFLLLRSEYAFDERLVHALVSTPDTILASNAETIAAHVHRSRLPEVIALFSRASGQAPPRRPGLRTVTPLELVPAYTAALRKSDPPYLLPARPEHVADIESRIFAASYKGVTDLVTKWIWPAPARMVTRWLAGAGVRPNVVTLLSWALVVLAAWLFARGDFALGLIAAWLMTFLDTVDGKLARVTLTSSKLGHVLDHGLDLIHPPFWYLAWAVGLPGGISWLETITLVVVAGYMVGRLIEGLFLLAFKMEIHCWQPIDSFFRTITARRNPNLLLLTAGTLLGRPDWGLLLVAIWTMISIGFHVVRLLQACVLYIRGHAIREWQGKTLSSPTVREATANAPDRSESLA